MVRRYIGFWLFLILNMIFVLFFLVNQSEFIISALFLVWVNMTIYSVRDLKSKGMLFAFCVAFFSFLMGRHLLSYYFDYEVEAFSEDVNTHAELCMLLSLVTVFFSYMFSWNILVRFSLLCNLCNIHCSSGTYDRLFGQLYDRRKGDDERQLFIVDTQQNRAGSSCCSLLLSSNIARSEVL